MGLAIGHRLGRYEIRGPVGAGAMGEVYRARDERLERDVAIKVLPQDVARDRERLARFEREARALAALSHPNILAIHDFGTEGDVSYAVTELLRGDTLRARLASGALPWRKAVEIASAIADGLAAAHERGIIHRDLKPENVFITSDGRVKILDFGLASLARSTPTTVDDLEAETEQLQTREGTVMGTFGYMAPEQLRAESADHRADIFALGCVLYEMLTGRRPFVGCTVADTTAAVLTQDPQPISSTDRPMPPGVETVVLRCLEKRPDDRFQSTRDLAFALRTAGAPPDRPVQTDSRGPRRLGHVLAILFAVAIALLVVLPPEGLWQRIAGNGERQPFGSIAVLPLENLSGDPEQEFFADGMTEELITRLTKIGSIDVISRTSVMRYKGSEKPLTEIAQDLGVDAVVEGSVVRGEGDVRITVQLIDGATDRHLWAESYQRPLRDVLTLQGEVAQAVAREINVVLTPDEADRLLRARPVDPEVHDAYLRAMHQVLSFTEEGFRKGMETLEWTIEQDPTFSPAYTGLGIAHANSTYFLGVPPTDAFPRALAAADRALELDPEVTDAHTLKGWVEMAFRWDPEEAERQLKRALELSPSRAPPHQMYSYLLSCLGQHEAAIPLARRAEKLDPLSPVVGQHVGMMLYIARRYDEAIEQLNRVIDLHPHYWFAFQRLAMVYGALGRYEEAIAAAERAISLAGQDMGRNGRETLAPLYALTGRRDEALQMLAELEDRARVGYVPPCDFARLHVALGDHDEAFRWLGRAVEVRDGDLFMTKVWPVWDPIRDDPRFDQLLDRLNLAAN